MLKRKIEKINLRSPLKKKRREVHDYWLVWRDMFFRELSKYNLLHNINKPDFHHCSSRNSWLVSYTRIITEYVVGSQFMACIPTQGWVYTTYHLLPEPTIVSGFTIILTAQVLFHLLDESTNQLGMRFDGSHSKKPRFKMTTSSYGKKPDANKCDLPTQGWCLSTTLVKWNSNAIFANFLGCFHEHDPKGWFGRFRQSCHPTAATVRSRVGLWQMVGWSIHVGQWKSVEIRNLSFRNTWYFVVRLENMSWKWKNAWLELETGMKHLYRNI